MVYLMVELRKLMEREGSGSRYPLLRLFCDWTVHTSIDRNHATESFLLAFDKAAESMTLGNGLPLAFLDSWSLSIFRDEMRRFVKAYALPGSVVEDQNQWEVFLDLYSAVISDCPISYAKPKTPFTHIRRLTLRKGSPKSSYVRELLGPKPSKAWMYWRVELKDGSVLQLEWPFNY